MKISSKITNHRNPPPAWQLERAVILQRACLGIELQIAQGQTFDRALRRAVRYYADRHYRYEPKRRFRISKGTLTAQYYHWLKAGRTVDAFGLKHRAHNKKLKRSDAIRFLRTCLRSEVLSYVAAHQQTRRPRASVPVYRHALAASERQLITGLFLKRRSVRYTERQAQRVLEGISN